jgi:hypothetical protein
MYYVLHCEYLDKEAELLDWKLELLALILNAPAKPV